MSNAPSQHPPSPEMPKWHSFFGVRAWMAYGLTALVLVGLWLVLRKSPTVSWESLATAMHHFPWSTLVLCFTLWSLQNFCSSVRFYVLLEPEARGSLRSTWQAISVGQWFNAFLPARVGDAMKLYLVNRRHRGHGFSIAGTLFADRFADLTALATVIVVAGAYRAAPFSFSLPPWPWIVAALAMVAALALASLKLLSRKRREKLTRSVVSLAHGLRNLRKPGPLAVALAMSVVGWMCESTALITLVRTQGFPFSIEQGVYLLFLLNAATAVPVSVGQMGTFEASIVYALGGLGVPTTPALAVAVTHHLLYFGMLTFWALATTAFVRRTDGNGLRKAVAVSS